MSTVYILGGGVAGLSAAHELAERGFDVVLFERHDICGGKARSMKNTAVGRNDLPGEHGFRFFPGFYWHLSDTMRRIKVGPGRTAFDNLVLAQDIAIAQDTTPPKPLFLIGAKKPKTLIEWLAAFRELVENPSLDISVAEGKFFVHKILCFVGSGPTRRLKEYEGTSWWDYIEAQTKSPQYQAILARGLSQSLVAMKPEKASALTVGTMLVQILFKIIEGNSADRVLNAPTNEAWIDPWVAQLRLNPKVKILNSQTVTSINYDAPKNRVTSVTVLDTVTNLPQTVGAPGDFFLSALPIDVVKEQTSLFPTAFKRAAGLSRPASSGVDAGVDSLETEWMTGVLFYMNRDVSAAKGHVIYSHSNWALTSITQHQFWRSDYPWSGLGKGQVKDILSTIISDWDTPGNKVVTTSAKKSKKQEIFDETWAQLKDHLALAGNGAIKDSDRVHDPFIDPAIKFNSDDYVVANEETLLVNTKNSRQHRPPAHTKIPNFFVASDYVLTETDLACMEAANEAARLAVNAVLRAAGSSQPPCVIQKLVEPPIFRRFQDIDELEYESDPSQASLLCRLTALLESPTLAPTLAPPLTPADVKRILLALLVLSGVSVLMLGAVLYKLLGF